MPIKTRMWSAPAERDDGLRVLVCRYRPRGLRKSDETWHVWLRDLGPSPALFRAFYGKGQPAISLAEYRARYREEMAKQADQIAGLAARVRRGETVTLLCSRSCFLPEACHRTVLAELVAAAASAP